MIFSKEPVTEKRLPAYEEVLTSLDGVAQHIHSQEVCQTVIDLSKIVCIPSIHADGRLNQPSESWNVNPIEKA